MAAARSPSPGALFDAGYQDLISISPPGAQFSPGSKLSSASAGKAPARKLASGLWSGYNWRADPTTKEDVAQWLKDSANVGLRSDRFPGLDIDAMDDGVAMLIARAAQHELGPAPVRYGRRPKRLLMYRLANGEPISRMRLHLERKTVNGNESHLVELLGSGQQYLVSGIHPVTNAPYTWDNGGPPAASELTPITRADVERFLEQTAEEFARLGFTVHREGDGYARSEAKIDQDTLRAPSVEALGALVAKIPNDDQHYPGRDDYVRLGYAVRAAAGEQIEEGFEVFAEWASRHVKDGRVAGNPETARNDYERMRPPFSIGWEWLLDQARRAGHSDAAEVFGVADAAPVTAADAPGPEDYGWTAAEYLALPAHSLEPVIPRFAWPESITLFSGHEKQGKSTLVWSAFAAASRGVDFCGRPCTPRTVVWMTEEPRAVIQHKLRTMPVDPRRFIVLPMGTPRTTPQKQLALAVARWKPDAVAIDSLYEFGGVEDENAASAWRPTLALFRAVTKGGAALVLIAHSPRGDKTGRARGSNALAAKVDVLLAMPDPTADSTVRKVTAKGRDGLNAEDFTVAFDLTMRTYRALTDHNPDVVNKVRALFAERHERQRSGELKKGELLRLSVDRIRKLVDVSRAETDAALEYLRALGEFNADTRSAWGPVDIADDLPPVGAA